MRTECLATFYKMIAKSIEYDSDVVTMKLVQCSTTLMSVDHEGIRILLQHNGLIKAISVFLCCRETPLVMKQPCYAILSSVIALAFTYRSAELIVAISSILHESFLSENEPENFHTLV